MSLDNIAAEELNFDLGLMNAGGGEDDNEFDLLIDPSKSRPVSPTADKVDMTTSNDVTFKNIIDDSDDDDVKINFSVQHENEPVASAFKPAFQRAQEIGSRPVYHSENNAEKQDLLFKLKRLESRGIPLSKHYSRTDSVVEMREEYERIKSQRDLEASIKFQRKTLMMATSGTEFVNKRFDPFGLKLNGWSESVGESIDDYDDCFEELHEKYKSKGQMAPELKLLMMIGGSAAMFHMSAKMFGNSDQNVQDIMNQNPDLKRAFAEAAIRNELNNSNQNPNYNDQPVPQPSFNSDENVMDAPPDDVDIDRILSSIDQVAPAAPPVPASVSAVEPVAPKKRRGRPKKVQRPETKSFSLNV